MPPEQAFAAVARIAGAVDLPVTADVEAGYQLSPPELVARLLGAGAVGLNLEDTDHHGGGGLLVAEEQAERIAAVKLAAKKAGVNLVLNARVDVFRGKSEPTAELKAEAIRRARLYIEAGADCVYPITLGDEHAIGEFVAAVSAPVNITYRLGAPTPERLAALGVARISLAGGLFRTANAALRDALERLRHDLGDVGPA
jgi:2-methylisocitrate lyase-like PEP mutase family enzyme